MGGLDILVNNAGVTRDNLFMRMSDEEWDQVIAVNLTATFRLSRACAARHDEGALGPDHRNHLVVGVTGNPGQGNYAACQGRHGRHVAKSLAYEVASRGRHGQLPWRRASSRRR